MADDTHGNSRVRILALGDSLTAGYRVAPGAALPDVLEELLAGEGFEVEIINAGVSGDTAGGGLARLPLLIGERLDAAIVEFGVNDSFMGLPVDRVRWALEEIIRRLKERGVEVMLAGTPAPWAEDPDYAEDFERIYGDLADKHGLVLYPSVLEDVLGNPELTQWDGLHPNERGIRVMAERMLPKVRELVRRTMAKKSGGAR